MAGTEEDLWPVETLRVARMRVRLVGYLFCTDDVRVALGGETPGLSGLQHTLQTRYGAGLRAREAIIPREERWALTFREGPGGWRVMGQRLRPYVGKIHEVGGLPSYVRNVVPANRHGLLPYSLAPRKEDLPGLRFPAKWRRCDGRGARFGPPIATVTVDAPMPGVLIHWSSSDLDPLMIRFPYPTAKIVRAVREYADRARAQKRSHYQWCLELKKRGVKDAAAKRRAEKLAHRAPGREDAAAEGRAPALGEAEPEAVPLLPRAPLLGDGDGGARHENG